MRRQTPLDHIAKVKQHDKRIERLEGKRAAGSFGGVDYAGFYLDTQVTIQPNWELTPSGADIIGRTARYQVMWPGLVLLSGSVRSVSGASIASLIGTDIFRMPTSRNPYPASQRFLVPAQKTATAFNNDTAVIQIGDPAIPGFFDLNPDYVPVRLMSTTISSLASGERLWVHLSGISFMQNFKPSVLQYTPASDGWYVDYTTDEHVA